MKMSILKYNLRILNLAAQPARVVPDQRTNVLIVQSENEKMKKYNDTHE